MEAVKPHEAPVGASVEWYTPPALFARLRMSFDLDPASPGASVVPWIPAVRHITLEEDGLAQEWFGSVWLNPPYGKDAVPFADKMARHGNGLLLLPARTETKMFQRMMRESSSVCFIAGRIHFVSPDGLVAKATTFGSALFSFGSEASRALKSSELGWTK